MRIKIKVDFIGDCEESFRNGCPTDFLCVCTYDIETGNIHFRFVVDRDSAWTSVVKLCDKKESFISDLFFAQGCAGILNKKIIFLCNEEGFFYDDYHKHTISFLTIQRKGIEKAFGLPVSFMTIHKSNSLGMGHFFDKNGLLIKSCGAKKII